MNKRTIIKFSAISVFSILLWGSHVNSGSLYRLKLADSYVKTDRIDKAISTYKKILRKENLSIDRRTLDANGIYEIYLMLANLYLSKGKFAESAIALKQMLEINPSHGTSFTPSLDDVEDYRRFALSLARIGLNRMSIKQMEKYSELKPGNAIAHYYTGLLYKKEKVQKSAIDRFKKVVELSDDSTGQTAPDYLINAYCHMGSILEEKANMEEAKAFYKKAIGLKQNNSIIALYNLKAIYQEEGAIDEANALEYQLGNLDLPYKVGYRFNNEAVLLGYSIDEREFELFNKGKVAFIWQIKNNRICDIREVENLAPNFGFEIDALEEGFPVGWDSDIYSKSKVYRTPPESHETVFTQRNPGSTQSLLLDNRLSRCVNCETDYIPIDGNSFYLQAGWLKSAEGDGRLGLQWFNLKKGPIVYNFSAEDVIENEWKHYIKIFKPPAKSRYCRLWVNNYENKGKMYFDNIIFFKLDLNLID